MAIVSRKEFAEMCGDDVKTLNVYINRRKVVLHDADGKKIDTDNLVNLQYKKNRQGINKAKKEAAEIVSHIIPNPRRNISDDEDNDGQDEQTDSDKYFASKYIAQMGKQGTSFNPEDPYIVKLKKDTELVELKIQKEQILLDKAAGKLIPIDIAASLLRSQARFIFSNIDNAIENIANVYCQIMSNGDMSMYSRIVEDGKKQLSVAIQRAGSDVDKDLENIMNDFSQHSSTKIL